MVLSLFLQYDPGIDPVGFELFEIIVDPQFINIPKGGRRHIDLNPLARLGDIEVFLLEVG